MVKCGKFSHGQRECGDSAKEERLMIKIDEEEYYQGRIIIAFAKNKNPIKDGKKIKINLIFIF